MTNPEALTISGGGCKIIAALGIVKSLEKRGLIRHVRAFSGSSAGALLCMLLVAGTKYAELVKLVVDTNLSAVLSFGEIADHAVMRRRSELDVVPNRERDRERGPPTVAARALDMAKGKGYFRRRSLRRFLRAICVRFGIDPDATFVEFKAACGGRELFATATDVARLSPFVFSARTTPDASIVDAVLASMSIPIVFEPTRFRGRCLVDGGVVDNCPVGALTGIAGIDRSRVVVVDVPSVDVVGAVRTVVGGLLSAFNRYVLGHRGGARGRRRAPRKLTILPSRLMNDAIYLVECILLNYEEAEQFFRENRTFRAVNVLNVGQG